MRDDIAVVTNLAVPLETWRLETMRPAELEAACLMLLVVRPPKPSVPWWRVRAVARAKDEHARRERERWERWEVVMAALVRSTTGAP